MLPRQTSESENKRPTQRAAAKALGVSYWHLSRVLNGHRESKSLKRRYREFLDNAARKPK
jgi:hypothetical protein